MSLLVNNVNSVRTVIKLILGVTSGCTLLVLPLSSPFLFSEERIQQLEGRPGGSTQLKSLALAHPLLHRKMGGGKCGGG